MKERSVSLTGKVNKSGALMIANQAEFNRFLSDNKGKRVVINVDVFEEGSSDAIKTYYYKKIVPDFQKAYKEIGERYSLEKTELEMRHLSTVPLEEIPNIETGKYEVRLKEIAELNNYELSHYISDLKQIAAEDLGFYIDDTIK